MRVHFFMCYQEKETLLAEKETLLADKERENEKVKWEEMLLSKQSEIQGIQRIVDELTCEMSAVKRQLKVQQMYMYVYIHATTVHCT